MRNARHDRTPRARRQKEEAGQGIVLKHDLPETAQADVDKPQSRGPRASRLPLCAQRFHAGLPKPWRSLIAIGSGVRIEPIPSLRQGSSGDSLGRSKKERPKGRSDFVRSDVRLTRPARAPCCAAPERAPGWGKTEARRELRQPPLPSAPGSACRAPLPLSAASPPPRPCRPE